MEERDNEISKNNALLIRNLLEISHGKRVRDPNHLSRKEQDKCLASSPEVAVCLPEV